MFKFGLLLETNYLITTFHRDDASSMRTTSVIFFKNSAWEDSGAYIFQNTVLLRAGIHNYRKNDSSPTLFQKSWHFSTSLENHILCTATGERETAGNGITR